MGARKMRCGCILAVALLVCGAMGFSEDVVREETPPAPELVQAFSAQTGLVQQLHDAGMHTEADALTAQIQASIQKVAKKALKKANKAKTDAEIIAASVKKAVKPFDDKKKAKKAPAKAVQPVKKTKKVIKKVVHKANKVKKVTKKAIKKAVSSFTGSAHSLTSPNWSFVMSTLCYDLPSMDKARAKMIYAKHKELGGCTGKCTDIKPVSCTKQGFPAEFMQLRHGVTVRTIQPGHPSCGDTPGCLDAMFAIQTVGIQGGFN